MMTFNASLVRDAIRLLDGRSITLAEAGDLWEQTGSRAAFLRELLARPGAAARLPEIVAAVERAKGGRGSPSAVRRERPVLPAPQGDQPADTPEPLDEDAFYERLLDRLDPGEPTALYVPRWSGVMSSTVNLFRQTIPMPFAAYVHPGDIDPPRAVFYADILLKSGIRHFVVSGGDLFNIDVIRHVAQRDPRVRFDFLWHSNQLQLGDIHDWNLLRRWLEEIQNGSIRRLGVVKSGFEEFFRLYGIDAVFVPNTVRGEPDAIKTTAIDDVVGVWLSGSSPYRKLPHAMVSAVKAMPGFYLKAAGLGPQGLALVSALNLPFMRLSETPIPYAQLQWEMARTAVSLYVTVSECSPMLPLESLSLGVPCLVGACSHLFRDHSFLHERLVVAQPYNSGLIADMAVAAARDRDAVIGAYRPYLKEQQALTDAALARFLS